jgi:diguanylate cyclase (GGDEF)-like protein
MERPLRLLIVDDQQPDAELSAKQIARGGFPCTWRRVENEADFSTELREFAPDLILSDFTLPQYNGLSALALAVNEAPGVPFIFVSGTIGEKRATEALARGAADYVSKNDLTRLVPAVKRVLTEPSALAIRKASIERVQRLTGALQMLSGMRAAASTTRTRAALLEEICRIVHGTKQYEYSFIVLVEPHTQTAHTVTWAGAGADHGRDAQFQVAATEATDSSVVGRVLRAGKSIVCFDIDQYTGPLSEQERGAAQPASAFVSLPLLIGDKSIGALTVGAATHIHISEPELHLLEELAIQISFALQTLPDENNTHPLSPFDPLTGLPKRESFCQHLDHLLRQRVETEAVTTVILFNIERLCDINDAHGRHVGDYLLQLVAERLKRRFGASDNLAHLGGGTFAAVFEEHRRLPSRGHESETAVFGQPFTLGGCPISVTVKCGLARYPTGGRDADALLQYAEAALGKIRERHVTPRHLLLTATDIESRQRGLEQRLRLAFKHQQFLVHYQPLIERVSGRVIAVEALLRWRDAERGLISPGVFLPALERIGLIVPVGEWVLSQAIRDVTHWNSIGLPRVRVAVNISPAELSRRDFAGYFLDNTRLARSNPGIDIEIAESALLKDPESLQLTLKALRGEGVRVAIDDFAMVHSSLSRLSEFPVDSLKIDRSFISHLSHQPQSQAVVSTIIALARAHGLRTVAEGVETIKQLEILDALGCEQSQGYLHSPAVPAEDLEFLVAARASGTRRIDADQRG